ncbi:MAG: isochorismatase family protein [Candidatus Binatia bacterium]
MSDEKTAAFYRERGLGKRVGFGRTPALVIVDFINGFTDPASPLGSSLDREIAATQQLLSLAREGGIPVHFTTIAYASDCKDAGVWPAKFPALRTLTVGSTWSEIDSRLSPRPEEVVWSKKGASAFFGTGLAPSLVAGGVDTVLITGCTTSGCVRATAVDSCQYGFRTIVVAEAVGDRARPPHDANLFDIDAKYGDVVTLQDAVGYLSARRAAA